MRAKKVNEGTWNVPTSNDYRYIKELEDFQKKIFFIFGDDEVHNGLDSAIRRMKELIK